MKLSKEFLFIRDQIEKISVLIITDPLPEVSFLLGQLHNICNNHAIEFCEEENEEDE